jgi:DNA-binding transcriptional LysR family regulator
VWHFATRDGRQAEVPVAGNLQSDNGQALLAGVRAGIGIALMPDWAIGDDLKSGTLRRLFPEHRVSHTDLEDGVYAVFQPSRHMSPKLRVFIDFIGATFRERERPSEA